MALFFTIIGILCLIVLVVWLLFVSVLFLPLILIIILITVGSIKFLIVPYFEKRTQRRLDENHKLIVVQDFKVRVDVNQSIDGFNPYVIDCYYTDPNTGRSFVFTSKPFLRDPSSFLNRSEMGVFVDPTDYSNYYVDTSFINE